MNKNKLFITFLESLRTEKNSLMIDSIHEGFALTEGFRIPETKNGAANAIETAKTRMKASQPSQKLSDEQVAERKNQAARETKSAKQDDFRVSGSMAQVAKLALQKPLEVEEWLEKTLKPAIKQGKVQMDGKFGTESSKRGLFSRAKSAVKSFTEGETEQ